MTDERELRAADAWLTAVAMIEASLNADDDALHTLWNGSPRRTEVADALASLGAMFVGWASINSGMDPRAMLERAREEALGS